MKKKGKIKRYEAIKNMTPREMGQFLADVCNATPCAPWDDGGNCKKWLSCAGCYWTWLCREIDPPMCFTCQFYEGDRCQRKDSPEYREKKNYTSSCDKWVGRDDAVELNERVKECVP